MAMDDDGAPPRRSSGGLSALSHQLMSKFSAAAANKDYPVDGKGVGGGENRSASAPGADNNNLVFSPLSIYSALSLAAAGARGRTLRELLDALGATFRESLAENVRCIVGRALPATPQPEPKPKREPGGGGGGSCVVEHACGLWHDAARALKPAFHDVAAASCNAVARAVDFLNKPEEARKQINRWVARATNNHIDSILPRGTVNRTTGMVVTTAIYFKGKWRTPFDASLTKEGKFHRLDGTTVDGAQFMRSHSKQYIATYSGFKVLKMPYAAADVDVADERRRRRPRWHDSFQEWTLLQPEPGNGTPPPARAVTTPPRYSMLILLPDKRDGLPALEDKMLASGDFLERHTPERRVAVGDFRVPRFKLSFFTEAKSALQELGVRAVFHREAAELPDVLEETTNNGGKGEPLFVGEVYHRAVIEVNEEGTEAAAATAMTMLATATLERPKPVDFVADHPFAFFVVEDMSGAVLFAGHVHDPTKS